MTATTPSPPARTTPAAIPHVVVLGAGFGGLNAVRALQAQARRTPLRVTIVDRNNFHTFQPLLYQVASAGLDPQDIGHSVRAIVKRHDDVRFRLGEVTGVDWDAGDVEFADGERLGFDHLVLAAGASTADYGIPGVEEHAFPLKSIGEALALRDHVLRRFEIASAAKGELDPADLTFVIAGGGPTGVELAGAFAELIRKVLVRDFPELDVAGAARVVLVELEDRLLGTFDQRSSSYAAHELTDRGVEVRTNVGVQEVLADAVVLGDGERIATKTLVWTAGVKANPIADVLGVEQTQAGRVVVASDLRIPTQPNGWVIGDLAGASDEEGALLPQLAPVAIQQGKRVAANIANVLRDEPTTPFRYRDKGTMATIGRNAAVAELPGGLMFRGFPAWISWLGLHLIYLIGFRNRLSVVLNWSWNYLTYDRGARLILGRDTARDLVRQLHAALGGAAGPDGHAGDDAGDASRRRAG